MWKSIYPRDVKPYVNLSSFYNTVGQYEKAATNALEAIRLRPDQSFAYGHLADAYLGLNQWQQVKAICEKAITQKLDDGPAVRWPLYYVGFIENDAAAMQRQVEWARSERNETRVLANQAMGAAYFGQLQRSRELFRQAIAMAGAEHGNEITLVLTIRQAQVEAQFGFLQRARDLIARARPIPQPEKPMAAVTLALTGDASGAQALVDELEKHRPQGTQVKRLLAPTVAAAIEMQRQNPSHAILLLQDTAPLELAEWGGNAGLSPIYLRGQAYLQMGAGRQAATEFQKIVDRRGVALFSPYHALARLGLAHGYFLQGDMANARKGYDEFFTLWKDADPDIPILKEAKAEYAKLQ
jgi:eukaryotic-like serine/threonine-protein kinase